MGNSYKDLNETIIGTVTIENPSISVELDATEDNVAISDGSNTLDITPAGAAKVDGSAVTQPVSAAALPLPAGAASEATLASIDAGIPASLGQTTMSASLPVVVASDQTTLPVAVPKKASYTAATAPFAPAALATDIFTIYGSASRTVKIDKIYWHSTSGTAVVSVWRLIKRSAVNTGGATVALIAVPKDSNNPAATATVVRYSANPALGTAVGDLWIGRVASITVSPTNPSDNSKTLTWEDSLAEQLPTLRGTSEGLCLNFGGVALPSSLSVVVTIEWTEE